MTLAKDRQDRFTYRDYLTWPEEERWKLIDGVAYEMAPAPSRSHQEILLELSRQVATFFLGQPCRVYMAPFDVRLPRSNEADEQIDTVAQPDLAVICDPSKLDERGYRGAPDWIIEVLSPATAAKDQIQKRILYERVDVKEYWTVHPTDKVITV